MSDYLAMLEAGIGGCRPVRRRTREWEDDEQLADLIPDWRDPLMSPRHLHVKPVLRELVTEVAPVAATIDWPAALTVFLAGHLLGERVLTSYWRQVMVPPEVFVLLTERQ